MCFFLLLLFFTDWPPRQTAASVSKNDSVLVIFSLCSDWFLGNSDVCFDVGFMNQICCVYGLPSLNSHHTVFKKKTLPSYLGVWYPGKPAGWQSGSGVCYIWKQVWQLPQIHGVQRPGLSQLQAAEARGVGSTRWPHRPLPTSTRSVIIC